MQLAIVLGWHGQQLLWYCLTTVREHKKAQFLANPLFNYTKVKKPGRDARRLHDCPNAVPSTWLLVVTIRRRPSADDSCPGCRVRCPVTECCADKEQASNGKLPGNCYGLCLMQRVLYCTCVYGAVGHPFVNLNCSVLQASADQACRPFLTSIS